MPHRDNVFPFGLLNLSSPSSLTIFEMPAYKHPLRGFGIDRYCTYYCETRHRQQSSIRGIMSTNNIRPPNGFTGKVQHSEATVGGTYKMSFTNFTMGHSQSFGGEYLELVPHERIRYNDRFDDPRLPGEMQVTITLRKVSVGTELSILQEGVPEVIPPEACYLGWQESLGLLAKLVEAEIPD
jgi:uncharacterized protein YndB with AHSA1/START domain